MNWIPDADLDPHPWLTWLAQSAFEFTTLALYKRDVILPPDFKLAPGTLIVSNHQRNSDAPLLAGALCQRSGLRYACPLPFFVAREDIYSPHFLRELLEEATWPRPLAALVGLVALGWLFRALRVLPLRRVREFTLEETLDALCKNGLTDGLTQQWLRHQTLQRIAGANHGVPATLSEASRMALSPLTRQAWGLRRLRLAGVIWIEQGFRAVVARQLRELAQLLDAGRAVYMAPEGVISTTGRMQRIRAGTARLYTLARQRPALQPLALSYDPLAPGRLRAVVHVGPLLEPPDPGDLRAFNTALRRGILELVAVTPSHLIAHWLVAGPASFQAQACTEWFGNARDAAADAGLTLDPVFRRESAEALVRSRLRWLRRRRLLRYRRGQWLSRFPTAASPGWHTPAQVARYMNNGLADLLSLTPGLARRIAP